MIVEWSGAAGLATGSPTPFNIQSTKILLMVLTFFLASLALLFAALAFGGSFFFAALAFALAFSLLVAGAVFGASAVLAVGSQTGAVGAGHLAVFHTLLLALFGLSAGGVGGSLVGLVIAVAGSHCEN